MPDRLLQFALFRHALSFYRRRISVVIVSAALLGLVGYATNEAIGLFYVSILTAIAMVAILQAKFGGDCSFFNVILANVITIYLCFFTFFVESIFGDISPIYTTIGFLLPLAAFLGGAVFKKEEIRSIIRSQVYINEAKFIRSFLWLIPIALVGVLAFALHQTHDYPPAVEQTLFLGEMMTIAGIAFLASRDFTLMFVDTGILFGEFFADNVRLIKSTFAFFILYSLNIVVFASIYRIVDRLSSVQHFEIHGKARDLTFVESMYYSLVNVATIGFGDIVPLSNAMRFVSGIQSFLGTLLFFFGVHAILSHRKA
jgi:voltage-gated potassium channel